MSFTSRLDRANRAFAPSVARAFWSPPAPAFTAVLVRFQSDAEPARPVLRPVSSQGVSLPGLGSFAVGRCTDLLHGGASVRAPVFVLHPKFDVLPQKKARFFLKKPATYTRINSLGLSKRCGFHKAGVTHVLKEFFDRIATCLESESPVDVDFTFARLTNVHGRVEFTFYQSFLNDYDIMGEEQPEVVRRRYLKIGEDKELTDKVTNVTPLAQEEAAKKAAELKAVAERIAPQVEESTADLPAPLRNRPLHDSPPTAATDPGDRFIAICGKLDRIGSGCIDRFVLERVLNGEECRGLIRDVRAGFLFDLLKAHAGGRSGRFVHYLPLLRDLEAENVAIARAKEEAAAARERELARIEEEERVAAEERARAEEEAAAAAKELARRAIANVISKPVDPAESIGHLFHSQGAAAKGQDRTQLVKFNREYAAAVAAYKKGSAGGVTPKVTNNHAADAAATESHVNQLGAFLQSQMDEKMRKEREERENWAQIENERIERGRREEAEAHDQEREKARRIAQELLAGWEKQQADRSKIKQSARVMGESWPFAPEHFKPTTPLRL